VPERYGVDVLFGASALGAVGVQRKQIDDLVASVQDGRLQKELGQAAALDVAILAIEGDLHWTTDGFLASGRSWRKSQHVGVMLSVQARGVWVIQTRDIEDTCEFLTLLEKWLGKRRTLLSSRPKPQGAWGKATNREWAIHFLQGFDGVGPELASRIFDTFNRVPLQWTVDEQDLLRIEGMGTVKAKKLLEALGWGSKRGNDEHG